MTNIGGDVTTDFGDWKWTFHDRDVAVFHK
jgi:hypothetical protein